MAKAKDRLTGPNGGSAAPLGRDGGIEELAGLGGIEFLETAVNLEDLGSLSLPGVAYSQVGSSRVDLQACKLEYSIVSPK